MFGKIQGLPIRGKADAIKKTEDGFIICDLKTTAQFSDWKYKAFRMCYDMQALIYSALTGQFKNTKFYFMVVETVAPYRTAVMLAGENFTDSGESKLLKCIDEIVKFGDREIDFHQNKTLDSVVELGDFSN